jgi:hypothetical protein
MLASMSTLLRVLVSGLQSRSELLLEDLALRDQLMVLRRCAPRPRLKRADRWFWLLLQGGWSGWQRALLIVQPRTVVGWHRLGFRLFWRWKSRVQAVRPSLDRELISLLRRMGPTIRPGVASGFKQNWPNSEWPSAIPPSASIAHGASAPTRLGRVSWPRISPAGRRDPPDRRCQGWRP